MFIWFLIIGTFDVSLQSLFKNAKAVTKSGIAKQTVTGAVQAAVSDAVSNAQTRGISGGALTSAAETAAENALKSIGITPDSVCYYTDNGVRYVNQRKKKQSNGVIFAVAVIAVIAIIYVLELVSTDEIFIIAAVGIVAVIVAMTNFKETIIPNEV